MKILIHECSDYSFCELPDGRLLYGITVDDVSDTLDLMSESGVFVQDSDIEKEKFSYSLNYNR